MINIVEFMSKLFFQFCDILSSNLYDLVSDELFLVFFGIFIFIGAISLLFDFIVWLFS